MSYLSVLSSSFKKLLSYLKSAPSNCYIWSQDPRICKKRVFNSCFVIGCAFSKVRGPVFSDSSGPGPSPLCKVCPEIMRRSQITMCPWSLSTYCDPLQFHDKLSGFYNITSTFILCAKVLRLNIFLRIVLFRL